MWREIFNPAVDPVIQRFFRWAKKNMGPWIRDSKFGSVLMPDALNQVTIFFTSRFCANNIASTYF
jgi:hypothetical protein